MRKPLEPGTPAAAIVADEESLLARVEALLGAPNRSAPGASAADYDADLIALRDQIAEEKPEDLPSLVEQMTRVQALAGGRRGRATAPIDAANPYFAHLRLRAFERPEAQDILIGRRGLIDRAAGVTIVDWRDAPVSQVYYRYDEGDDYEEEVGGTTLKGVVEARRNVTIAAGQLRRVGCPQGTFVASGDGRWFVLEGQGVPLLEGGAATAARPPRRELPQRGRRFATARPARAGSKQLPEIASLIDRDQFDLITVSASGLVVIQGGAGSGKTTVALHRIAYLVYHEREAFKPSHCLFVVPSAALARYVEGVLPALGVPGVPVTTWASWARNLRRRLVPEAPDQYAEETPPAVSRLKKHPELMRLLERAVASELVEARAEVAARLSGQPGGEAVLASWDEHAALPPVRRVRKVKSALERLALAPPVLHTAEQALKVAQTRLRDVRRILWELYTDRGRLLALVGAADPVRAGEVAELCEWASAQLDEPMPPELDGIDEERLRPIDGKPLEGPGAGGSLAAGKLDPEDDALLMRAYQLAHGGLTRVDGAPLVYDHIAVDEAQDLSVVELKVLYEALTERRSITIAGDAAQRVVFDNGFRGWTELVAELGLAGEARVRPLHIAYRSTAQVMRFARAVLGPLAPEAEGEVAAREGAEVAVHELGGMGEAVGFVAEALRSLLSREPAASVALLTRHTGQADAWYEALRRAEVPSLRRVRRQDFLFQPGVDVSDVTQVKGLEFDYVILLDVNQASYPASVESRHLLHIGATRATHQLWIVATGELSELVQRSAFSVQRSASEAGAGAGAGADADSDVDVDEGRGASES